MSLLLYGVIAANTPLVMAPELQLIIAAGLAAVVRVCEMELNRDSVEVLAYGEQVRSIHQQTTIIPMRYGSLLADQQAVTAYLLGQAEQYRVRLIDLENCDEMGIRLWLDDATESKVAGGLSAVSGHDYLLSRKRVYAVSEQVEQQVIVLNDSLAGLYRQHCAEISIFAGQRSYLLSYLVPRSQITAFQQKLQAQFDPVIQAATISGPWPPYNFVG